MNKKRGWALIIAFIPALLLGVGLYLLGFLSMVGDDPAAEPELTGTGVLMLLIGIMFLAAAVALFVTWFATQNSDMNRLTGGRFNTVLWTLLLFVPIAAFVSLYKFADHIRLAQTSVGITGMPHVATFLIMLLTGFVGLSFVGFIVAQIQMDKIGS